MTISTTDRSWSSVMSPNKSESESCNPCPNGGASNCKGFAVVEGGQTDAGTPDLWTPCGLAYWPRAPLFDDRPAQRVKWNATLM